MKKVALLSILDRVDGVVKRASKTKPVQNESD